MRKNCSLIGMAIDIGQPNEGTELAPSWLRLHGITENLGQKFFKINDLGDFTLSRFQVAAKLDSGVGEHILLAEYAKHLSEIINSELNAHNFVLTLGGDHSLATATLAGTITYNPNVKVIWVDAHADINTPTTSPSGNLHGMPVALAMKLAENQEVKNAFAWMPKLDPKNIVYIGLRDVDAGEQKFLKEFGITYYTADAVKARGIGTILAEIKEIMDPEDTAEFHISFDVDGVDPRFFPATGTPVEGGIDLLEGRQIIEYFSKTGRVIALDLVEINPLLGEAEQLDQTIASAKCLINGISAWTEHGHKSPENQIWPMLRDFQ